MEFLIWEQINFLFYVLNETYKYTFYHELDIEK